MSAHDVKLFGDQIAASRLEDRFARVKASSLLRLAIEDLFPRPHRAGLQLRRGFGGAAAHGRRRRQDERRWCSSTPGQHFPETLALPRRTRARGSAWKTSSSPSRTPRSLAAEDPEKISLRRAIPTAAAKSARCRRWPRRSKASRPGSPAARVFRARRARAVPLFEAEGERVKVNPLVGWSASRRPRLTSAKPACRPIPWSPRAIPRSAACPAPARSGRAKIRAPAAGAAAARPNAASTPSRFRRDRTSDGSVARRRLRRRHLDDGRRRRADPAERARSSSPSRAGARSARR